MDPSRLAVAEPEILNGDGSDLRRRHPYATEEWFAEVAMPPPQKFFVFKVTDFG